MKNLLVEKLDIAIQHEKQMARRIKAVEYTLSESMDILEELMDAEEARENAERNLIIEMSDELYNLYSDEATYEDCIDHAATQVGKIAWRIEKKINNYLNKTI